MTDLKPFEFTVKMVGATADMEATIARQERMIAFGETLGLHFEDGDTREMGLDEVLPESPLEETLRTFVVCPREECVNGQERVGDAVLMCHGCKGHGTVRR